MPGITREMIEAQLAGLEAERQDHLANLHSIAGAEALCRHQLLQLDELAKAEKAPAATPEGDPPAADLPEALAARVNGEAPSSAP